MTDRLSFNAERTRSEAAPRAGRRRPAKSVMTDRALAELEALLTGELEQTNSPPLATHDDGDEPAAPRREERPAPRPAPARRPPLRPGRARNDNPVHPRDLDADVREWGGAPGHRPAPLGALHRPDPHAPISRAMRFSATVFSVIALAGVSALLVLLAAGGDRAAPPFAENLLRLAQLAVASNASAPVPQPVQADATVTGSIEKPEVSRIAAEGASAQRGGGVVTAADAQQAAVETPQPQHALTPQTPDSSTVFSPPARETSNEAAPSRFAASPAPVEVASAASAEPVASRSTPVTTHVNMRASPDNDAAVVAVVPAGKNVGVVECTRWCEVAFDGKQGFIHKRFLKE